MLLPDPCTTAPRPAIIVFGVAITAELLDGLEAMAIDCRARGITFEQWYAAARQGLR